MDKKNVVKISTLIGKGCVVDGNFTSPASTRIDGIVNGDVTVAGQLILGAESVINGDVRADAIQIGGEINGNVEAPEHTELTGTARVIGDISTSTIVVDENAVIQGSLNMNQETSERKKKASIRRAARNNKRSAAAAVAEALKEVQEEEAEDQTTE